VGCGVLIADGVNIQIRGGCAGHYTSTVASPSPALAITTNGASQSLGTVVLGGRYEGGQGPTVYIDAAQSTRILGGALLVGTADATAGLQVTANAVDTSADIVVQNYGASQWPVATYADATIARMVGIGANAAIVNFGGTLRVLSFDLTPLAASGAFGAAASAGRIYLDNGTIRFVNASAYGVLDLNGGNVWVMSQIAMTGSAIGSATGIATGASGSTIRIGPGVSLPTSLGAATSYAAGTYTNRGVVVAAGSQSVAFPDLTPGDSIHLVGGVAGTWYLGGITYGTGFTVSSSTGSILYDIQ
jgi:hypothetical protein